MKKILLIAGICLFTVSIGHTQKRKLPSVTLKNIDGKTINTADISNDGKPIVISFWATWCSPCKKELNTIAEDYEDWQDETGVKLIAVSIDDRRSVTRVKPYVNSADWDYEVLLDTNSDFKRAMGVNNVPHTFLLNGKGEIVWQHNNYAPGDEKELLHELKKL